MWGDLESVFQQSGHIYLRVRQGGFHRRWDQHSLHRFPVFLKATDCARLPHDAPLMRTSLAHSAPETATTAPDTTTTASKTQPSAQTTRASTTATTIPYYYHGSYACYSVQLQTAIAIAFIFIPIHVQSSNDIAMTQTVICHPSTTKNSSFSLHHNYAQRRLSRRTTSTKS